MNILFLEDNEEFAEALMIILESLNHRADLTASVNEAIRLFSLNAYDAVITDIHLKGEDQKTSSGFELVKTIRHKRKSNVVIAATSGLELLEEQQIKKRGVDIFYHKPVHIGLKQFINEIEKLVSERKG